MVAVEAPGVFPDFSLKFRKAPVAGCLRRFADHAVHRTVADDFPILILVCAGPSPRRCQNQRGICAGRGDEDDFRRFHHIQELHLRQICMNVPARLIRRNIVQRQYRRAVLEKPAAAAAGVAGPAVVPVGIAGMMTENPAAGGTAAQRHIPVMPAVPVSGARFPPDDRTDHIIGAAQRILRPAPASFADHRFPGRLPVRNRRHFRQRLELRQHRIDQTFPDQSGRADAAVKITERIGSGGGMIKRFGGADPSLCAAAAAVR